MMTSSRMQSISLVVGRPNPRIVYLAAIMAQIA
jgi:hypothetical protein